MAPVVLVVVWSLNCVSLWPHGLQHAMLPCPSLSSEVCSDSCPLSQWCHPTISSSAARFCFYLQSSPASGSFLMTDVTSSKTRICQGSRFFLKSRTQIWAVSSDQRKGGGTCQELWPETRKREMVLGKTKLLQQRRRAAQDSIPGDRRRIWTNDTLNMTKKPGIQSRFDNKRD